MAIGKSEDWKECEQCGFKTQSQWEKILHTQDVHCSNQEKKTSMENFNNFNAYINIVMEKYQLKVRNTDRDHPFNLPKMHQINSYLNDINKSFELFDQ